ncbi:nephrin-like [Palaemon carinicauda]|uniref:nephrin-like n=1 Tax=Palaemon carinicauda TaxID=392227 RepID=UPI0035B62CFF
MKKNHDVRGKGKQDEKKMRIKKYEERKKWKKKNKKKPERLQDIQVALVIKDKSTPQNTKTKKQSGKDRWKSKPDNVHTTNRTNPNSVDAFKPYIQEGSSDFQHFTVIPESLEVREGEDVFLRCVVQNQRGKAQWTKDGFALGFERNVPGYPRYSYAGDPELGEHHLVIKGVTLTEDGEYQCQVGPTITDPPIWTAANVTVLLPPKSVRIVGWNEGSLVQVMAGHSINLECLVADARPPPSAIWYRGPELVEPNLQEDDVGASTLPRRWNLRSQLVVKAEAEDDGREFSCQASHPALRSSMDPPYSSIILSVLHPPGNPIITGYDMGEALHEGERRNLTCLVRGGNPTPWMEWYRDGRLLDDRSLSDGPPPAELESVIFKTYQVTATAEENNAVYMCSVSNDLLSNPLTTNVTITVHYKPRTVTITGNIVIEEGGLLDLTCRTSPSNPPAAITWVMRGKLIASTQSSVEEEEGGGWITSSVLKEKISGVGKTTHFTVECRASNPAVDNTVKATKVITITKPLGAPVLEGDFGRDIIADSIILISCFTVGGFPPPTLSLYKNNDIIKSKLNYDKNITRVKAEINITPVDNKAEITCQASNEVTTTPLKTSARLSVLFPPWNIKMSIRPVTVEAGERVTIKCESSSSLPPANITWRSSGTLLRGASTRASKGSYGGTYMTSELELRTTAGDNGRMIECIADNRIGAPLVSNITLTVLPISSSIQWFEVPI